MRTSASVQSTAARLEHVLTADGRSTYLARKYVNVFVVEVMKVDTSGQRPVAAGGLRLIV